MILFSCSSIVDGNRRPGLGHCVLGCVDPDAKRAALDDEARLRQVVVNLLSNAVRFTASGGQVDVGVTCGEAAVVLVVSDTGIGIDPAFLPQVFERFRQGDAESTTGLGLGLAIVKNLVELHRGTVVASSEGIGRGSQFTVTLPRKTRATS